MATGERAPRRGKKPTPEEQTEAFSKRVQDWNQFVADIEASDQALDEWRAAGNPGVPPGAISARDYLRQRAVRSDAE
jgi:hypothetical protein